MSISIEKTNTKASIRYGKRSNKKDKRNKGIILHSDQGWQYQNKRY